MHIIKRNIAKYQPRIIQFEQRFYVGFVDEKELDNPQKYFKFKGTSTNVVETEPRAPADEIYKMSLTLYFRVSCMLKESFTVYNLNKIKHELNNK